MFDPYRDVRIRDLRGMGFPFPEEIPDDAYVAKRAVRSEPVACGQNQHAFRVIFSAPIRLGNKEYRTVDGNIVVHEQEETGSQNAGDDRGPGPHQS